MARVVASAPLNIVDPVVWFGNLIEATSSRIIISDGFRTGMYLGENFQYSAYGEVVGGILTGYDEYHGSELAARVTDASVPAATAYQFIANNNLPGLFAIVLADDDIVSGSSFNDRIRGFEGDDVLNGRGGDDWVSGDRGHDTLRGGSGNDMVLGRAGDDRLIGGSGDDLLKAGGGSDLLRGNAGADKLLGGGRSDTLAGGGGNDVLKGGGGDDLLEGGRHADKLLGGGGNDALFGDGGDDLLKAGGEDDLLNGGAGHDLLFGGPGADEFVFAPGHDTAVIKDYDLVDTINLTAFGFASVQAAKSFASDINGDVVFDFSGGEQLIVEDVTVAQLTVDDILV